MSHYVPVHPECWAKTMVHRPTLPTELTPYAHWYEAAPQLSGWDKFWLGAK